MSLAVELFLQPDQNLYHSSKVYSGLVALKAMREISLRTSWIKCDQQDPLGVLLKLTDGNSTKRILIDLHDRSNVLSELHNECDIYFKRSYYQADVDSLPASVRAKLRPLGLNYGVRIPGMSVWTLLKIGPAIAANLVRMVGDRKNRFSDSFLEIRNFLSLPLAARYEVVPTQSVDPVVLFQTRVWHPSESSPGDAEDVNESRVGIIRALRREFGARFLGGLIPTAYAREHYPDLLTTQSSDRSSYAELNRRALIGIYSRGLHHSDGFKLPEYLASSKAIVGETPRNQLPVPLSDGVHFDSFQSADECIEKCCALLDDPKLAKERRRSSYEYYKREVEPAVHMRNILDRAMSEDTCKSLSAERIDSSHEKTFLR